MIRRLLFDNLIWKVLSLAAALVLWLLFVGEPELVTSQSVPILYKNLPRDLQIGADVPERVRLELRGPASKLTPGSLAEAAVLLDLSGVHKHGEHTVTLTADNISLPAGVSLVRAVPSQLRLQFDRLMVKEVPVEVRFSGPPAPGYRIVRQEVLPNKVEILGPELHVRQIDAAQTDAIDLSGVVSQAEFHVQAFVADPQVRLESAPMVTVRVYLAKGRSKGSE